MRRAVLILGAAGFCASVPSVITPAAGQPGFNAPYIDVPSAVQRVAVFGSDDRRELPAAYQHLAQKIGVISDLVSRSQCTAFCLSGRVIATAAHCLFRTRDEELPDLRNFRFQLHGRPLASAARIAGAQSSASVAHVAAGSMSLSIRPPIEATKDWALVRLDVPACTAGGLPISQTTVDELASNASAPPVYQAGYHRDFRGERLALGGPCHVSRNFEHAGWKTISGDFSGSDQLILHSCDTGGASSGSPLLIEGANGPEVVGINVGTYVQSRVLMVNGAVAHRYQAENVANTGVSARLLQEALDTLELAQFLTTRTDMRELQLLLSGLGIYSGARDGLYGAASRSAIEAFERLEGRPTTGLATAGLLGRLRAHNVARAPVARAPTQAAIETGSVRGLALTSSAKSKSRP